MKVLIINNFNNKLIIGGVENYLLELKKYSENSESSITYEWYGSSIKKTNWIQKLYNYYSTKEIIHLIDRFNPDIVHCYSIGAPVTPHFMKYAKKKNIPILYSFRDYYYICPKNLMINNRGEIITEHRNSLDCIFNHLPKKNFIIGSLLLLKQKYHKHYINKYVDYYLTPSKNLTKIIGLHFDLIGETLPNPLLLTSQNNIGNNNNYILYVGRLIKEKGVFTLLKSFKKIKEKYPEEKLVFAGEGGEMEELIDFCKINNLKDVSFLGNTNRDELKKVYSNAKFVVAPSEILESYGNIVLESFAFKKTIIISDLLGLKDEVIKYKCGLVFQFGNVDELTNCIETLLTNITIKKEFSNNGFEFSKTRSLESHIIKQTEIYKELLKKTI
ncbi:glycosyltransferase family 4 protein [Flavobacterium sp.]|uniref:glycosyltransferase family 4 protein n=1 Tax=Flavobacterium sp. TaxID=239 RepID=UPI004048271C